jgi:hypothetical protein
MHKHHRRFCSHRFFALAFTVFAIHSVSCRSSRDVRAVQADSNVAVAQSRTPLITTTQSLDTNKITPDRAAIEKIDFKNFTFPWYPSYLKSPYGARSIQLSDGEFEVKQDQARGIEWLSVSLANVSYINLANDERKFAVVSLAGTVTNNSFVGCIFVYALEKNELTLMLRHETGDRAAGGLRRVAVEGLALVIEQYKQSEGSGLCCPQEFIRRYYQVAGSQLREFRSETIPANNSNAEFLGYPGT